MSHGKQFTLYTHNTGPNGWKVAFVLEELGLTYESIYLEFNSGEHKRPPFTDINPNGRIPALIDHRNGDFTVWESGAIILYLVDKYDTEKRISVADEKERYHLIQWLFFQASGQGPYFGQAIWFMRYHSEKVPSAVERYQKEILRIFSVLDGVLAKAPGGWLVGGKLTVADLSFIPWNNGAIKFVLADLKDVDVEKQYPALWAWHQKLLERESVKKCLALQFQLMQS
ncbi:glutathione S-transferase C-terminal-like protein [Lentinus tigrinus ALCF2SS1-7]|uniref:glutathione S-transferase C-terminal-like protein n=1 Tax=Lentinus tigrinus ALCF2SS1-7 TaxID=1328758 RepID=UPI001165CEDE|nr:glutathione S-transferase C-terminal-like protein [Lentinus tigrinus ALCF2SS1-7]